MFLIVYCKMNQQIISRRIGRRSVLSRLEEALGINSFTSWLGNISKRTRNLGDYVLIGGPTLVALVQLSGCGGDASRLSINSDGENGNNTDGQGNVYDGGSNNLDGNEGQDGNNGPCTEPGTVQWAKIYKGEDEGEKGGRENAAYELTVDLDGNLHVIGTAGFYNPPKLDSDIWFRKLNPAGEELMPKQIVDGTPSDESIDEGRAITTDNQGYIHATGQLEIDGTKSVYLGKRDSKGNTLNSIIHTPPNPVAPWFQNIASGIKVDEEGNVHLVGWVNEGGDPITGDIWVAKFDYDYNLLWERTHNGPGPLRSYDRGYNLDLDDSGNVYVIGFEDTGYNDLKLWIRKYSSNGDVIWTKKYPDGSGSGTGFGIATGQDGVYASGTIEGRAWLDKFDFDGNEFWNVPVVGMGGDTVSKGRKVIFDNKHNLYVVGGIGNTSLLEEDPIIRKINPNGEQIWRGVYNDPTNGRAVGVALGLDGSVYTTGATDGMYTNGGGSFSGLFYSALVLKHCNR